MSRVESKSKGGARVIPANSGRGSEPERRSSRPLLLIGGIALAVLLLLGAVWLGRGSGGGVGEGGYADIPQEGVFLGSADAPLLIRDFSDFSCPHCKTAATQTLPPVIDEYVRTGQARIEFIPIAIVDPTGSAYAAMGSLCAADQEQFWPFQERLFQIQGQQRYDASTLSSVANSLGMNVNTFQNCLASNKYLRQVQANAEEFRAVGGTGTPTFIIGNQLVSGAVPFDDMKTVIDAQLAELQ